MCMVQGEIVGSVALVVVGEWVSIGCFVYIGGLFGLLGYFEEH